MVVNQLFIEKPPIDFVNKYVKTFGLNDINDSTEFTTLDILCRNTIIQIQHLQPELIDLYLPCKKDIYVSELTTKNIITILRQLVKLYDKDICSREKFIKGTKYLAYRIITPQEKKFLLKSKKKHTNKEIVIVFD
jgi:hypothetical protein